MEISIKSPVYPTEDIEKVRRAIETLLGRIPLEVIEYEDCAELVCSSITQDNLLSIRRLIHEKRILDAVRIRLLKNYNDLESTTGLYLDKQAASIGKIRLIDNDAELPPLGSIEIQIAFKTQFQFAEFLDWFSPRTKNGKIVT
jgi:predicted RNA binding protein with dsRBD fold (UPF0201 family)